MGEVEFDIGLDVVGRAKRGADDGADRAADPRHAVNALLGARRVVHDEVNRRKGALAGGLRHLDRCGRAEHAPLPARLEPARIHRDIEGRRFERLLAEQILRREIGDRRVDLQAGVGRPHVGPEIEVDFELAIDLPAQRRSIERQAGVRLQRLARQQIANRRDAARDLGDNGGRRRLLRFVGDVECPARRRGEHADAGVEHADAGRREGRGASGDVADAVDAGQRRHAGEKFDASVRDAEIDQQAIVGRRMFLTHPGEIGGVEIELHRPFLDHPLLHMIEQIGSDRGDEK